MKDQLTLTNPFLLQLKQTNAQHLITHGPIDHIRNPFFLQQKMHLIEHHKLAIKIGHRPGHWKLKRFWLEINIQLPKSKTPLTSCHPRRLRGKYDQYKQWKEKDGQSNKKKKKPRNGFSDLLHLFTTWQKEQQRKSLHPNRGFILDSVAASAEDRDPTLQLYIYYI